MTDAEQPPEPELELAHDPRARRAAEAAAEATLATGRRKRALLLMGGLGALVLFDGLGALASHLAAPREVDWQAASRVVRSGFKPGDLLVAAPAWSDPILRAHLGDLLPVSIAARSDSDRFTRVWEVSIRGHQADEAVKATCQTLASGRVRVRLCEKPAARVLWDAMEHFAEARVTLVRNGREEPCLFANRRFSCNGTEVTPIVGEIDYRPHECLLAPPASSGALLRIEWLSVPLGTRLVAYTGIHSFYARKAQSAEVDVAIDAGGAPLRITHHNEDGWLRRELDTAAQKGRSQTLRVEVGSRAPAERKLCFRVEARS